MPLFRRQSINASEAQRLAEAEARRRGWAWGRPTVEEVKKGFRVRLRPDEMASPFVLVSKSGRVLDLGFEERYLDDDWYE